MFFLPTYRRPGRCQDTLDACVTTGMTAPGLVIVNGKDKAYDGLKLPENWKKVVLPKNLGFCGAMRWVVEHYPDEPFYGILTDDQIPVTDGWDAKLIRAAGTDHVSSSNDGWQAPQRMHGAICLGGDLVRKLGFITPPGPWHSFTDDFWEEIGRTFGIWDCLMDVMVEHHHPGNGTGPNDSLYPENYAVLAHDESKYRHFMMEHRQEVTRKVAELLGHQVRMFDLSTKRIAIATPAYGGQVTVNYLQSLLATYAKLTQYRVIMDLICIPNESLVPRARNSALKTFLAGDATNLLFIDADMGWNPDSPIRLLAADKDFVAAAGPRKATPTSFCVNFDGPNLATDADTGCVAVDEVGSGFMMLSRSCVEKMVAAHPETEYQDLADGQTYHALFDTSLSLSKEGGPRTYWSEDYTFCQRWRATGGTIWVDPTIRLEHVGSHTWEGALVQTFKRVDAPMLMAAE